MLLFGKILFPLIRYKIIQVGVFVIEVILCRFYIRRIDTVPTFQRHVLPVPVLPYRLGNLTGFAQPDRILALLCRQGRARKDFVILYRLPRTLRLQPHIAVNQLFRFVFPLVGNRFHFHHIAVQHLCMDHTRTKRNDEHT